MQAAEQLALTEFWFAWDDATTRRALLAAVLERFSTVAERVFRENAAANRCPTDWKGFQKLRRNERNVRRLADGENGTTIEFLVGAAALLRVDVRDLFPETAEWVALASLHIASWQRRKALETRGLSPREAFTLVAHDRSGPTLADARVYARVLLDHSPCSQTVLNGAAVEGRLNALEPDQARAVRTVAAAVAAVIADRDAALGRREDSR